MIDLLSPDVPAISLRNVGFSHGSQPTLAGVSLDLFPARHYIVAGPNGAGKSTLLDILCNLKRPQSGAVGIAGRAPDHYPPGQLARRLALAPQEYTLDFSFTIREIVAMGRRPYLDRWGRLGAEDEGAVGQALEDLHLSAIADKSVLALSGGEKRRCIVARALAQATPILLLDEPDSGLDVRQAMSVMALAKRKAEEGALVVTVSHDLNLAARYCHDFIFLKNGRLAAHGPVEAVFTDDILANVYETGAKVGRDAYAQASMVSFRL